MELILAALILAAVAGFVLVPLRRRAGDGEPGAAGGWEDPELADLEARKAAKYREIRDTELDRAQGKLGEEEFARQDAELRAEAIEILKRIDELERRRAGS
jgi:hypothetical protein